MKCSRCAADNPGTNKFCASCGAVLDELSAPPDRTLTMPPPGRVFSPGDVLAGRYRIEAEIGQGGMGRVYKAYDARTQEDVALKIIQPWFAADPAAADRFRRELKQARRVAHRNVVRVFDLGEAEGTAYISMEYVAGQTLDAVMRLAGRLDADTAAEYARQIADGLAEAHRAGIIHRDLKPRNIMVASDGTAKIMDFGIARSGELKSLTGPGAVVGTPAYMAPEQAAGKEADARSDIYALGRILQEMVMGRAGGKGQTPAAPGPSDLDRIIRRCIAEDPGQRFQTAAELRAALEGRAAGARPDGGKRSRGRRAAALIAAVACGAAILGLALGLFRRAPSGPPSAQAFSGRRLIAVLPFQDLSPDLSLTAFAEGLADDLRTRLAGAFDVLSRYSSDRIRDAPKDTLAFIKSLNVDYYVEGTIGGTSDLLLANIKISEPKNGIQRWTRPYGIAKEQYYTVKDDICRDAAAFLGGGSGPALPDRPETADLKSHFFIIWGRYYADRYVKRTRDDDFAEASRNYQAALAADPESAKAYYGLGGLYENRFAKTSRAEDLAAMTDNFRRAFDLDPGMPEAHLGLGWAAYHRGRPEEAYREFGQAYAQAPRDADINFAVGSLFRTLGLYREALPFYERAIQISPLDSQPYSNESSCYWYLAEYDKARDLVLKALAFEPETARLRLYLARLDLTQGRLDDAEREIAAGEKLGFASESLLRLKIWLLAARGRRAEALALVPKVGRAFLYEITNAYCLLNMPGEAVRNIRLGIEKAPASVHDEAYVYPYLTSNPLFLRLADDPEFRKILAEEKVKDAEKRRRYPVFRAQEDGPRKTP